MTWSGTYTLARINGTDIKVTMPGNPCTTANVKTALGTDTSTTNKWLN